MGKTTIRLGLLGCGKIAATHLEAVSQVDRIKLTSVCDIDLEKAKTAGLKYHCSYTEKVDELLRDPNVDAVLICTPPVFHFDLIKKALLLGKHVLCEKPFTLTLKEALEIKSLTESAGRLAMMASKFRFVRDVMEARRFIQAGTIGDVILSEVIFCSKVDMTSLWNANPKLSGGGVLIDNGSHAVDLIHYLVGPIKNVYAQKGKIAQAISVEDTARLHFETENKIIGMVDLSWSLFKRTNAYVNILGTLGTIEIGWGESIIWDSRDKSSKVFGKGYHKLSAFIEQLEHFADCLTGRAAPLLSIDDAVESVRVLEAAYTSIRENKCVEVPR